MRLIRMIRSLALSVALAAGLGAPAAAAGQEAESATDLAALDLPVSFSRIKSRMAEVPELGETRGQLRLNYRINVYGRAPAIEFLQNFIVLDTAPAAYGGPTHAEMIEVMTPKESRPRAISTGNLLGNWRRP